MTEDPSNKSRGGIRLWVFRLVAMVAMPLGIFFLVEGGLRVVGYGHDGAFLVKDAEDSSLVRDNYKFFWRFFPKSMARSPQPIRVAKTKPEDLTRVVVVGGSAAMGDPEAMYGVSRVIEVLLEHRFPQKKFEVINAAVTAINSHVVRPIVDEAMALSPDAVVIYMGNNEVHGPYGSGAPPMRMIRTSLVVKSSKIWQFLQNVASGSAKAKPKASGGMEMFLKQSVPFGDPRLEKVYSHYRTNLIDTIGSASEGGAKVVLSTVAVNLGASPPFSSIPNALNESVETRMDAGLKDLQSGDSAAAVAAFDACAAEVPGHAEIQFQLGRALLAAGRPDQAKATLEKARDLDALRFRADSRLNAVVKEIAAAHEGVVALVDAEEVFAQASPDGVPGENLFWEHVHLSFDGNYLLGVALAEQLVASLTLGDGVDEPWLGKEACRERLGLSVFHEREVTEQMRTRLAVPPFTGQSGHEARDQRLKEKSATLQGKMSPELLAATTQRLQQLVGADPRDWMLREALAAVLIEGEQREAAIEQWKEVAKQMPHYASAHLKLGELYLGLNRRSEAVASLQESLKLAPNNTTAQKLLEQAKQQ